MTSTTPPLAVIPAGAVLAGDFHAPGDARIAGRLSGELRVEGRLTLDTTGCVGGKITAAHAALHGQARADVTVHGQTELFPGAQVRGVLSTAELTARDGARFEGRLVLGAVAVSEPLADSAAVPAPVPATSVPHPAEMPVSAPTTPPAARSFSAIPGATSAGLRLRAPAG